MAWIFVAESEDSQKPWLPGSNGSPTVKTIQRNNLCWFHGCPAEKCKQHRSGMTLELFEAESFQRLILSEQQRHARTSALLEIAQAWAASEAGLFGTSHVWPKKLMRALCFSKTSGRESGSSFPRSELRLKNLVFQSGMVCFPLEIVAHGTNGKDGSCLLPTPSASPYGYNLGGGMGRVGRKRFGLQALCPKGLIPTPLACRSGWQRQRDGSKKMMLPKLWNLGKIPTPVASEGRRAWSHFDTTRHSPSVSTYWRATTGTNAPPSFFEWIQGFRIGATVFEPWATLYHRSCIKKPSCGSRESDSRK